MAEIDDLILRQKDKFVTDNDKLFKKALDVAPNYEQQSPAIYEDQAAAEQAELKMMQAPEGLGTDLMNVAKRMPGQLESGARRALAGATDIMAEVARGQESLYNVDDPGGEGSEFWKGVAETGEEQTTLQGFEAESADITREKELPLTTETGQLFGEVGQSMAAMVPALAAGIITQNPLAATFVMGHQTGLETFQRARAEGMSTEAALGQAVATGAAEGIFESAPTALLFSWFKKGSKKGFAKHLKDYLSYVGAEIGTEIPTTYVQTAVEIFYGQAEENPEKAMADMLSYMKGVTTTVDGYDHNAFADARHTALVTALQSTILGAGGKGLAVGARKVGDLKEKAETKNKNQAKATEIAAGVMRDQVEEEAATREGVVFDEAEAIKAKRGEEWDADKVEGNQPFSVLDDSEDEGEIDRGEREEKAANAVDDQAQENVDDINADVAEANEAIDQVEDENVPPTPNSKKVITNWATGEWEWQDDAEVLAEEEAIQEKETVAAEDTGSGYEALREVSRGIYERVRNFAEFSKQMVKAFGANAKKHALKLWNAYKSSRFSSDAGAIGDIENVPKRTEQWHKTATPEEIAEQRRLEKEEDAGFWQRMKAKYPEEKFAMSEVPEEVPMVDEPYVPSSDELFDEDQATRVEEEDFDTTDTRENVSFFDMIKKVPKVDESGNKFHGKNDALDWADQNPRWEEGIYGAVLTEEDIAVIDQKGEEFENDIIETPDELSALENDINVLEAKGKVERIKNVYLVDDRDIIDSIGVASYGGSHPFTVINLPRMKDDFKSKTLSDEQTAVWKDRFGISQEQFFDMFDSINEFQAFVMRHEQAHHDLKHHQKKIDAMKAGTITEKELWDVFSDFRQTREAEANTAGMNAKQKLYVKKTALANQKEEAAVAKSKEDRKSKKGPQKTVKKVETRGRRGAEVTAVFEKDLGVSEKEPAGPVKVEKKSTTPRKPQTLAEKEATKERMLLDEAIESIVAPDRLDQDVIDLFEEIRQENIKALRTGEEESDPTKTGFASYLGDLPEDDTDTYRPPSTGRTSMTPESDEMRAIRLQEKRFNFMRDIDSLAHLTVMGYEKSDAWFDRKERKPKTQAQVDKIKAEEKKIRANAKNILMKMFSEMTENPKLMKTDPGVTPLTEEQVLQPAGFDKEKNEIIWKHKPTTLRDMIIRDMAPILQTGTYIGYVRDFILKEEGKLVSFKQLKNRPDSLDEVLDHIKQKQEKKISAKEQEVLNKGEVQERFDQLKSIPGKDLTPAEKALLSIKPHQFRTNEKAIRTILENPMKLIAFVENYIRPGQDKFSQDLINRMVNDFSFEFANYKGERGYVSGPSRADYLKLQQDGGKGLRVVPVNVMPDVMRTIIRWAKAERALFDEQDKVVIDQYIAELLTSGEATTGVGKAVEKLTMQDAGDLFRKESEQTPERITEKIGRKQAAIPRRKMTEKEKEEEALSQSLTGESLREATEQGKIAIKIAMEHQKLVDRLAAQQERLEKLLKLEVKYRANKGKQVSLTEAEQRMVLETIDYGKDGTPAKIRTWKTISPERADMAKSLKRGTAPDIALRKAKKRKLAEIKQTKKLLVAQQAKIIGKNMAELNRIMEKQQKIRNYRKMFNQVLENEMNEDLLRTVKDKSETGRIALGIVSEFVDVVTTVSTAGRSGKANFFNKDYIVNMLRDKARKTENSVLQDYNNLNKAGKEKVVTTLIRNSEPTTGTWEAKFYNEEMMDEISFTAENVLDQYSNPDRWDATMIDKSVERIKNTPMFNIKGYTVYDYKYTDAKGKVVREKNLTKTEVDELLEREPQAELTGSRKNNQGEMVGVRFHVRDDIAKKIGTKFKDFYMTKVEFDRMEDRHDPSKHEAYEVLYDLQWPAAKGKTSGVIQELLTKEEAEAKIKKNDNIKYKKRTVEEMGKGKLFSGWDFYNDRENLLDAAAEMTDKQGRFLLPTWIEDEIREDLNTLSQIELIEENPELYADLIEELPNLPEAESRLDAVNALKWQIRAKDSRLAENMKVVKAITMADQIKKLEAVDPNVFDELSEQIGMPPAALAKLYAEVGGDKGIFFSRTTSLMEERYQEEADDLFEKLARTKKETPLSSRQVHAFVISRFNKSQKLQYRNILDGKLDSNSAEVSLQDRVLFEVSKQLEARLNVLTAKQLSAGIGTYLSDNKIQPTPEQTVARKKVLTPYERELSAEVGMIGRLRSEVAQQFYEGLAKVLGADLVIISDPKFVSKYIPEASDGKAKVIVNIQAESSFHHVYAHEIFHSIVNRSSKAEYAEFVKGLEHVIGKGKIIQIKAQHEAEGLDMEEFHANLFSRVMSDPSFFDYLSKTGAGKSLAQKIFLQLLKLVKQVNSFIQKTTGTGIWRPAAVNMYEGKMLFENNDIESIYELFGDLIFGRELSKSEKVYEHSTISGALNPYGTLNHKDEKNYSSAVKELKGYASVPLKPVKGLLQRMFAPGTKGYKDVMTNMEGLITDAVAWFLKHKGDFWFAHVGADKVSLGLAESVAHAGETAKVTANARAVKKYKDTFKGWSDADMKRLHDDFVRGVQRVPTGALDNEGNMTYKTIKTGGIDVSTDAGKAKARKLGYSDEVVEAMAAYKKISDEIFEKLVKIYPELAKDYRKNHYGQSLIWMRNGIITKDSFDSVVNPEFSSLEGDKTYLERKNTRDTTDEIAEKHKLKLTEINPHNVFLKYVEQTAKVIALHEMINKGTKLGQVKIFTDPKEATAQGFRAVEDPTFIIKKMNLAKGFKVKINEENYWNKGGQDVVFSTMEDAQDAIDKLLTPRDNPAIYSAEIEATKPDMALEKYKHTVYRILKDGKKVEINSFKTEDAAREFGKSYGEEGTDFEIRPAFAKGKQTEVAQIYFKEDLAKLLDIVIAKDWVRNGSFMGIKGQWLLNVKNHMTSFLFALSLFHVSTIGQEIVASNKSWAYRRYGVKGTVKGLGSVYSDAQDIHMILMGILGDPKLMNDPAVQKKVNELFGTTNVDALDVINMYFAVGGIDHLDTAERASTYNLGKPKYYAEEDSFEIVDGEVVFKKTAIGKISVKAVMGAVGEVWDNQMKNEPDKKLKALFNTTRFAVIQQTTAWLMETGIPKAKMAMWAREYTLQLDLQKDAIASGAVDKQDIAREAMLFVEDKVGEVNWINKWMKPAVKTSLMVTFNSFTWFTGAWSALGKAGIDIGKLGWFTAKGEGAFSGKDDRYKLTDKGTWFYGAIAAHLTMVQLVNIGYMVLVMSGDDDEVPTPEDTPLLTRLLFPRYDPSDPEARVAIPSYITELFKISRHLGVIGDEPEPTKLISGRLSTPIIGAYETFWTGTDFSGTLVRNPNDSLAEQAFDSLVHTFGVLPISISSAKQQMVQKGWRPEALVLGLAGFVSAPAAAKRTSAANYGYHLSRGSHTTESTEEEMDDKLEVRRATAQAARGDKKPLQEMLRTGRISQRQYNRVIKKIPRFGSKKNPEYVPTINRVINILTVPNTILVIDKMTVNERKESKELVEKKFENMVKRKEHGQPYIDAQRAELKKRGYDV